MTDLEKKCKAYAESKGYKFFKIKSLTNDVIPDVMVYKRGDFTLMVIAKAPKYVPYKQQEMLSDFSWGRSFHGEVIGFKNFKRFIDSEEQLYDRTSKDYPNLRHLKICKDYVFKLKKAIDKLDV